MPSAATATVGSVELDSTTVARTVLVEDPALAVVGVGSADVVGAVVDVVDGCDVVVACVVLVVVAAVVEVVDGGGAPPRAAFTSEVSEEVTTEYRLSPGQVVLLIVRCPVIVGVVTVEPAGHRFDPRDVNVTSAPAEVLTPCLSASQASRATREESDAPLG